MTEAAENIVESVDDIVAEALTPRSTPEAKTEGDLSEPKAVEDAPKDVEKIVAKEGEGELSADGRVLKYKGKEIHIDDPKYQMYAQKGFDYEQKMHQFRVERKLWEEERSKATGELEELKQINDFAKQNPEFERLIQREWAKHQGGGGAYNQSVQDQSGQLSPAIQSQLNSVIERLNAQESELKQRQKAEKEASLEGAIETYKESYKDYDWGSKDEFGQSLEDRITDFALDKEIKDFSVAADAYLMKEHLKRAEIRAKEKAAEELKKQHKLGLGKVTDTSQLQVKKSEDLKNKSYNDLVAEALAEIGA